MKYYSQTFDIYKKTISMIRIKFSRNQQQKVIFHKDFPGFSISKVDGFRCIYNVGKYTYFLFFNYIFGKSLSYQFYFLILYDIFLIFMIIIAFLFNLRHFLLF